MRFYAGTVVAATIFIVLNIYGKIFYSFGETIRYSAFQVSAIITSTGFSTADFNVWPVFSQCVLLLLMFIGASAGSTGGGIKCIRVILLLKIIRREAAKIIHPRAIHTVTINGKPIAEETLTRVMVFFFLYIFIIAVSVLAVSLDGKDMLSSATAVIAAIGNIGPGLGAVGPIGSYADFSVSSKLILSICMIVGRLEIYPILLLFSTTF